jgi:alpha-beta hydrolase superfamily lysophospholipase
MKLINILLLFFCCQSLAALPDRPQNPDHPGSDKYEFTVKKDSFKINNQKTEVFLPAEIATASQKAPVLVFAHGQAIGSEGYSLTFEHLAKKGIAVIHPGYDTGFFDQDWKRMGDDFNKAVQEALVKYSTYLDAKKIIYAGHSKGGYVALTAAGSPSLAQLNFHVGSIIVFAPAGYDSEYIKNLDPQIPLTLIWSDADTIVKKDILTEIYNKAPSSMGKGNCQTSD